MLRAALVAIALSVAVATAFAQADLVAARKALMDRIGDQVDGTLRDMVNGSRPYDRAAVDAIFVQLAEAAQKMPPLYAESTRDVAPTGRYGVSRKVWDNKADFDARVARFAGAVAEAAPKASSAQGLREAHRTVRASCSACHDAYRIRN